MCGERFNEIKPTICIEYGSDLKTSILNPISRWMEI